MVSKKYLLEPFYIVYQSELLALRQAVRLPMEVPRYGDCDILSDSRSFLNTIANRRSTHTLVMEVRLSLPRVS